MSLKDKMIEDIEFGGLEYAVELPVDDVAPIVNAITKLLEDSGFEIIFNDRLTKENAAKVADYIDIEEVSEDEIEIKAERGHLVYAIGYEGGTWIIVARPS